MKQIKWIAMLLIAVMLVSCHEPNSDAKIQMQQEEQLNQAADEIGIPAIPNHKEKKDLKRIYELRDQENYICYVYFFNEFTSKLKFFGKCVGYGIPYATQFSAPEKLVKGIYSDGTTPSNGTAEIPISQAEPNGLHMPASAEATWIMMLDKDGNARPIYCEPKVIVSPFELSTD